MDSNRYSHFFTQLLNKFEEALTIDKATLSMVLTCDTIEQAINELLSGIKTLLKGTFVELWFNDVTYNRYYSFDPYIPIRHISRSQSPSLTAFHFDHLFDKNDIFYSDDLKKIKGLYHLALKNTVNYDSLLALRLPSSKQGIILIYNPKTFQTEDLNLLSIPKISMIIEALLTVDPIETDLFMMKNPPININALSALEKIVNPNVHSHELKVSILAKAIGIYLKYPYYEVQKLSLAGRLHDLGKLFIPKTILLKTNQLSSDETKLLRTHVTIGQEVLCQLGFTNEIVKLVFEHHERYNGQGYPQGLKSYQWTIESQIIAISSELVAIGTHDLFHEKDEAINSIYDLLQYKGQFYSRDMIDTIELMIKDKQLLHLIK